MTAPFRLEVFGEGREGGLPKRLIPGCETEACG